MKAKILFKPYVNFIIVLGAVLGIYSWRMDSNSLSLDAFYFFVFGIALSLWEERISKEVKASFSSSVIIFGVIVFGIRFAILLAIGTIIADLFFRYVRKDFDKHLLLHKTLYNINEPIICSFAVWKLNRWMNINYIIAADIWKVILLATTYLFIGYLFVSLLLMLYSGKINFNLKELLYNIFYNTVMAVLLIYTYHDRGITGIIFISTVFIPILILSRMHSKLKTQEQELFIDSLTQVYNYRFFKSVIFDRISKKKPFAFVYMDLNNFKMINDNYGHDIGNRILEHFTEQLKERFGDKNIICRFGGDEFCVIADNNNEDIKSLTLFLENKNNFFIIEDGKTIKYSTSYGVSHYTGKEDVDWKMILESADKAMYQNKKSYSSMAMNI